MLFVVPKVEVGTRNRFRLKVTHLRYLSTHLP